MSTNSSPTLSMSTTQTALSPTLPSGLLLQGRDVRKTYRMGRVLVPVLRGVDIDVKPGEWVAILGASGSGKSTLLHLLGGLDTPDKDSGPIRYAGRGLNDMSSGERDNYRNTAVGFVFQFYHLLPELTVVENALVPAMAQHGFFGYMARRGELREKARELLTAFGLGHRLKHRPRELSGGERQRVAIARALINEPAVLLADEPTGNLDHVTGGAILDAMVAQRNKSKRAMVMVTHDREVAARADRVIQLYDGLVARPDVPR